MRPSDLSESSAAATRSSQRTKRGTPIMRPRIPMQSDAGRFDGSTYRSGSCAVWTRTLLLLTIVSISAPVSAEEHPLHVWNKTQLQSTFYCEGAHAGDFNKDGHMDVVSGPYWYEGPDFKKSHEFYPAKPFDKNTYSQNFFAFADDIDKDGWTDIIVVGFPGADSWWFKNPQGKEGNWERYTIDDYVGNESIPYVDVNADGIKDLVYLNKRGQYGFAHPDPADPTKKWIFNPISAVSNLQRFTHGEGVGDVNNDGRLDILEMSGWWEQPEPGTKGFWKKHEFPFSKVGGAHMYAYDFDGDGDNDVITSLAAHQYGLAWYEQVEDGSGGKTFKQHIILKEKPEPNEYGVSFSQPHAVDLVDIDRDGVLDIVTGKRHWAHNGNDPDERGPAVLYWFRTVRGKDGVTFVPYLIDDDSGVGTQVQAVDLNNDGLLDIVVGNKLGTFIHLHSIKNVSKEEWEKAQPKRNPEGTTRRAGPDDRVSGVVPKGEDGRELNLGFEDGTLTDWKRTDGLAHVGQPIKGDNVAQRRPDMQSGHVGEYWIGTYEKAGDGPQGGLSSVPFEVTHPYASFLVGGGSDSSTRVELVDYSTGQPFFRVSGINVEDMKPVLVDLRRHKGKTIAIRIIDRSSGGWGHINFDDFRFHEKKPVLRDPIVPRTMDEFQHAGLSAEKAAKAMQLPEGFRAEVIAAEPDVIQPVAMTIDERGRVWVAEAMEYPIRAKEGEGRDRILIFEDADADGTFETRKIFAEKLNLVSGIEVGFGGVFVGAAPYLMFIPDRDRNDAPDGPAEILLDGWAYQDTHETLNSFIWGPDGWLYGCHGVFTHSNVGKPGDSDSTRQRINAGIWRYHPTKKAFEVFAHGTSNPWGVDFNDRGQCFLTCCVIPHLFHVIQGARYHRQAGQHFNPHTYADIPTVAKHRHWVGPLPHAGNNISASAGGGHAHAGAMFYLGSAWPKEYRDQLFMNNVHGARINVDAIAPNGSGYVGDRAPDFLITNDQWSQMLYLRGGPDGQVVVIDWYDANQCHRLEREVHDQSNGRIYRIAYGESKPVAVDLSMASDTELVAYQLHANDWYVRTARRILQERAAEKKLGDVSAAIEKITKHADETRRLRGHWALHSCNLWTDKHLVQALADDSPYVRGFAIQFAMEDRKPSEAFQKRMLELAKSDRSPIVRLYLASAADRLPAADRWELVSALTQHADDGGDHNLPLMYWYAAEPLADVDASRALTLAVSAKTPLLAEFMARRVGSLKENRGVPLVIKELDRAEDAKTQAALARGLAVALKAQRQIPTPPGWGSVSVKLLSSPNKELVADIQALSAKFGDEATLGEMRKLLEDPAAPADQRRAALETLLGVKDPELVPVLQKLLADKQLRQQAIRGLANFANSQTAEKILAVYGDLTLQERHDALATLASRKETAVALLDAIEAEKVRSADVGADIITQLRALKDKELEERLGKVWGVVRDSAEDKLAEIARYQSMLASKPAIEPDPHLGRAVFARSCATCHELFGTGSNIGPGLTGSNRRDVGYLLHNIIDPSAVMAKEYQPHIIATVDGRVITGIVKDAGEGAVKVRTANEEITLPRAEIEEMTLSSKSMMPEDQWSKFSEHEIRSLVAYLASSSQVPMLATADTASLFFNGQDLSYWHGNKDLWRVENGEIVGKSPGLKHNEFLKSDLLASDVRLRFKVKLAPNAGNSGVQFRSEELPGTEMRGYQADIGQGWWGKLYEESGRGLLWDKSGESHVRLEDWNDYEIVAKGPHLRTFINGKPCVDVIDPAGAQRGIFALQLHAGEAMEVRFKDLSLEVLDAKSAPAVSSKQ